MPAESLKKLEAMDDKELEQTLGFMLGNGRQEAAESFKRKIEALVAAHQHEPAEERPRLPKPRALKPERAVLPKKYDPEEVIAEFYDGGLPKGTRNRLRWPKL
jgi:hypothetical protein